MSGTHTLSHGMNDYGRYDKYVATFVPSKPLQPSRSHVCELRHSMTGAFQALPSCHICKLETWL